MSLRQYTSTQLLELRPPTRSGSSSRILAAIEQNPDFAELHKKNHVQGLFNHVRRTRSTRENTTTSTDGEEQLLFKGKRSLYGPTAHGEWRYRGRTDSQATASGPISAPPGLAAQQSEGFKRFYKAVVSPSHVRVTAGGRIVPNTRPSTSPTAKWDRETTQSEDAGQPEPVSALKPHLSGLPAQSTLPPFIPPHLHHQYFQHMGIPMPLPMPMYPLPNGFPMAYGYPPLPQFAPFPAAPSSLSPVPNHLGNKSEVDSQCTRSNEGPDNKRLRPGALTIATSDANEQAPRPVVHNGHYLPPLTMTGYLPGPYFPAGWPGAAALPEHRIPPMAQPASAPLCSGSPGVFQLPSDGGRKTSTASSRTAPLPRQASPPPLSSIKPSSVTKRQLDSLRSSLKFYEDQLAYNKHQIDEKATVERADRIRQQIAQFERNLKLQQDFEAKHYPKESSTVTTHQGSDTAATSRRYGSSDSQFSDSSKSVHTTHSKSLRHPKSIDYLGHSLDRTRSGHIRGLNASLSVNDDSSSAALEALEQHIQQKMETSGHGALPTITALAPPFLPVNPLSSPPSRGLKSEGDDGSRTQASQTVPYLVGTAREPLNTASGQPIRAEYSYPRVLTAVEKQAREVYWGNGSQRGTGLPKFDGKDFYPPSPTKPRAAACYTNTLKTSCFKTAAVKGILQREAEEHSRGPLPDSVSGTSRSGPKRRLSHAIPIVAPSDTPWESAESKETRSVVINDAHKVADDVPQHNHNYEAHTSKSTIGLWPNMMRKGSAGGSAALSTVTSTTVTGFLPQYTSYAAASLAPSVSNCNITAQEISEKGSSNPNRVLTPEKTDENRPPLDPAFGTSEAANELHRRLQRDGERREM